MKMQKYQLKNKMDVILVQSTKSPVVSVQMWVKTGSADETASEAGLSHFIEHLVFKGTPKYDVGQIAAQVEGDGGELNAYTSFDETVFYVTISSQFKETALDVISQMMGFPKFDPIEVDKEREVVIEEIKRGQDSPGRRASQMLFSNLYKKHNYRNPVIGYDKIIKTVSVKKIKDYYFRRYVPSNMFLVIAGDFESKEMKALVQEKFGAFRSFPLKKVVRKKEPLLKKTHIKVEKAEFKKTTIYIAWPTVKTTDSQANRLEILALILGLGESSRLVQKLRMENLFVNGVGAFNYSLKDNGFFAISMTLEKENLKKALDETHQVLKNLLDSGVTSDEIQKAKTINIAREITSLETVDYLAQKAGQGEMGFKDPNYSKKILKEISTCTAEDINKIFKKFLFNKPMVITAMTDGDEKETATALKGFAQQWQKQTVITQKKIQKKSSSKTKTSRTQMPALKTKARYSRPSELKIIELKSGGTLLARVDPSTPSIVAKVAFRGGLSSEGSRPLGTTELLSRTWSTSTQDFSELQMAEALDNMSSSISSYGGRNTVGMTGDYLSSFEGQILPMMESLLLRPLFSEEVVDRERQVQMNQIKARQDNPAQICMQNFMQSLFEGHSYSKDMLGTEGSLQKIAGRDLSQFHQSLIGGSKLVACVVGDIDPKTYADYFTQLENKIKKGSSEANESVLRKLTKSKHNFVKLEKEQSHLVVGYQGLDLRDPRRFQLDILESVLSGQGGRLFIELRDKKSLAYSVSPMNLNGLGGGYVGAYIACSPEKVDLALKMLKDELNKMAETEISSAELLRAQRYLIGRHDIGLQQKSSVCNSYLFDYIYGLDPKQSLDVAKDYFAVTPKQVRDLAAELFSQPEVISLVGPSDIKI